MNFRAEHHIRPKRVNRCGCGVEIFALAKTCRGCKPKRPPRYSWAAYTGSRALCEAIDEARA